MHIAGGVREFNEALKSVLKEVEDVYITRCVNLRRKHSRKGEEAFR